MIKNIVKLGFLLSILLILLLAFAGSASAQTIEVNPGDDVRSIINEAQAEDTIYFNPGTYTIGADWIIPNKPLSFSGAGADKVVINDFFVSFGFFGYGNKCDILTENLTFSGGGLNFNSVSNCNVIIRNCVFRNTYQSLSDLDSYVQLLDNEITYSGEQLGMYRIGNLVMSGNRINGEYLYLESDNGAVITNNTFTEVASSAIFLNGDDDVILKNNVISNCGTGIYFSGSNNAISENTFDSNSVGIKVKNNDGIPDTGNKIYLNNFINNGAAVGVSRVDYEISPIQYVSDAVKYSYKNKSYTSELGNYYSDYSSVDANNDGIGDTPYAIVSGSDTAPLMGKVTVSGSEIKIAVPPSTSVPIADFTATPTSGDAPLTVNFTDDSTGNISSYSWDFDNNGTVDSTEQNPSHTYSAGGTYTVNLTVANATLSNSKTKKDYIEVISKENLESEWPEFQKDSSNSGYSFSYAPTRDTKVLWQTLTSPEQKPVGSGGVNVPPVISGNKVFVTAGNASVWAFNKENGNLLWYKELGGSLIQTATPAIGDGKLFVPTLDGDLYALDPETGNELWKTHVTDGSLECPITYADHKLYIGDGLEGGTGTKYYYCYDDNGNLVWKHENTNSAGFLWSGAVVVGKYLVYPVFEGKIVCLDKDTGTVVDQVDFSKSSDVSFALADPGMFRSSVTYANGALYTSSERGQNTGYCFKVGFNPDTGQLLDSGWTASIGFSTSTPVVYNGRVYVGHGEHGETGSMFCLNDSDGSTIWNTPVSGGVKSSPVVSVENGKPYIYFTEAITDGSIYCLNPDGTLAWHYNPPADSAYTLQGAALSDGKVYYGTDSGYLYCIGQGEASNPTANFTSDKQTGSFPLTVSFKDTSVNANKFFWDFGDGSNSTEVNPVHTYTTAGSYTVTLTVQNEHGKDKKIAKDYIYAVKMATTWPVNSGQSIQAAIDKAGPGDIIKVYPGEYHEVLTINKALTLKGIRDPVLNTSGLTGTSGVTSTSGVTISADGVNLSGFKITGTGEMSFAIHITAKGTLIENNLIDNCAEGIWLEGTGNILRGNNISNCWDFAAVLDSAGGNRIYQNTFINNKGRKMGGSSNHISGGAGSYFQSPEPVEYLWKGQKLTGYMGNYYDDYTGTDSNGDGIGDTAYTADGGTDQYPLVFPFPNYAEAQENALVPEDSWYQFHGKADHLGYSANGPKTNRTEWVSEDIDAISSTSPVTAEGRTFVICGSDGMEGSTGDIPQLVALNESTGNIIWKVSIPDSVYGSWASPAYDNGMVFTATGPELGCYNAKTGEKLWTFNNTHGTKGAVNSGPVVADGMVIFNDWDGSHYYCLDEYTGDVLWSFEVKGDAQSVPAYANGKLYLTSWEYGATYQGHAYCVDALTGKQIWHTNNVVKSFCGSPAYKDGVLYLTTYDFYGTGDLLALNANDGQIIWQQTIERSDSTPAFAYGNVYICGGSKGYSNVQTYCFNATTGAPVWSTPSKTTEAGGIGGWTCSVAVADGLVYVGSEAAGYFGYGSLYALNAYTGDIVWNAPYAGSSPALSDGMLFSIGGDQKVYAFKDPLIPPVANFTGTPISGDAPLTVNFSDASTGTISSYAWDFDNDGIIDSTEQNPSHTYAAAGNYTVNLTVNGTDGSDSEVKTEYIIVNEPLPAAPVANFTTNVTSGVSPHTVEFDASTSQNAALYSWDFGDRSTGTGQVIGHTFNGAGTYNVVLNVTNSAGIVSSYAKVITVTSAQGPALTLTTTADPTTYSAAGQKIKYTYTVTNIGSVQINGIKVTDNKNSVLINSATLAPGSNVTGTGTYTIKQSDINAGSVTNTAYATGRYSGKIVTSNTVTTTVTSTFVPSPALTITKTSHQKTYNRAGRTITYTYVVKNTGNVPIGGIKVTDDKTKVSLESSRTLSPGSSVEGESNYVIKQADVTAGSVTNSAYATGMYNGQAVNSNTVTATITYRK